ncbi:MAG: hypothetical protein R2879_15470 [Saprospiraceae bacterium]
MVFLEQLRQIGIALIKEEPDYLELSTAINDYKELLNSLTPYDIEDSNYLEDVNTEGGRAIGTRWAAMCLEDIFRTKTFVKGIYEAIQSLHKTQNEPIRLLYAGTGPYATLILPLLPFFTPDQLQLGLIEINPLSFDMVKSLFKKLALEKFVSDYYLEDATTFQFQKSEKYDLILSETMQNGLRDEPQVSIFINLLQQFPDALLVPERVTLSFGFYSPMLARQDKIESQKIKPLEEVFVLDAASILTFKNKKGFDSITIECHPKDWQGYAYGSIFTKIKVFGNNELLTDQSGLTVPIFLFSVESRKSVFEWFTFQYENGLKPGLKFTSNHVESQT